MHVIGKSLALKGEHGEPTDGKDRGEQGAPRQLEREERHEEAAERRGRPVEARSIAVRTVAVGECLVPDGVMEARHLREDLRRRLRADAADAVEHQHREGSARGGFRVGADEGEFRIPVGEVLEVTTGLTVGF